MAKKQLSKEAQEIEALRLQMKHKKERIELKYSRVAKRYLQKLNEEVDPNSDLLDMTDEEFDYWIHNSLQVANVRLSKVNDTFYPDGKKDLATMTDEEFDDFINGVKTMIEYYNQTGGQNYNQSNNGSGMFNNVN